VGESDTVVIVTDMLAEVFGYEKYSEITSEYAIKSTFCDLATKIDGKIQTLIEVKAIGLDLKDSHVKQAVDYAANQGVDWVLLTNGISWRVYHVVFAKPIAQELVIDIDFCVMNHKSQGDLDCCTYGARKAGSSPSLASITYKSKRSAASLSVQLSYRNPF
jgi:Type I restriction enzyme R protein N terminus (HSDR_N)